MGATLIAGHAQFSFDGINDQLTHCAAPPLFYSHLDRMISGSKRTGALLTLASISIPIVSTLDQILSMAHVLLSTAAEFAVDPLKSRDALAHEQLIK